MSVFSFIMYCFIVTVTPGTTNVCILSTVQNDGIKAAMKFTYGSLVGFFLLLSCSAMLNAYFVQIIPTIIFYIKIIGTGYLLYVTYQIYKMDVSKSKESSNGKGSFKRGLFIQLLNPKPVIFTLTLFPSFVLPYYNGFFPLSMTVLAVSSICFTSFTLWVLFGAVFKEFLRKYNKQSNIVMATFLLYATGMIWF